MIEEAKRVGTVLEFHLSEARKLVERLESLEEIAVEQRIAERVGRGRWRRTEFEDPELGDLLTLVGRREGFKKVLSATLRRLRSEPGTRSARVPGRAS